MIVVVKKCSECPFCSECADKIYCNVSVPKHREVTEFQKLPFWCPLNKEQIIVKNF